jgi:hypothetical protein
MVRKYLNMPTRAIPPRNQLAYSPILGSGVISESFVQSPAERFPVI